MASFSYNIAQPELPLAPRVAPVVVPTPQVPYVNPGGNLTLGEFVGGGAPRNMYGMYDPQGAANVRAVTSNPAIQAFRQSYSPGQYGGSVGLRPTPAAFPAGAPPLPGSAAMVQGEFPFMNPNAAGGAAGAVRPSVIAPSDVPVSAAAKAGGSLSRVGGTALKALPIAGDVLQAGIYGYNGGNVDVGRGVAAGLGSLGGRLAGGAAGTPAGPVGTVVGQMGGGAAGAAGAAKLYDMATGSDSPYKNPEAMRQTEINSANRAVPSRIDMPQGLTAKTGGEAPSMRIDAPAPGSTTPQITRQQVGEPTKYDLPSAASKTPAKPAGYQAPSADEMARFRKETGTAFDSKSINDKLNLDRMRAGEGTFDSKQASAYRASNSDYRPGQYVKGGNPSSQTASAPMAPAANSASAAPTYPSLEQRGLAKTVSSYDPVMGTVERDTEPQTSRRQQDAALRQAYYARNRAN